MYKLTVRYHKPTYHNKRSKFITNGEITNEWNGMRDAIVPTTSKTCKTDRKIVRKYFG